MQAIFDLRGRPVVKTGEKPTASRHGTFILVFFRFIDGCQPAKGNLARGQFDKLKAIRGGAATVWHRVDQLTQGGMEPKRALQQATAEFTKGVLA